jgi:hypothetical protein
LPDSIKSQATLLELLEGAGMGDVAATMALESDATRRLGDVLADAVKVGGGVVTTLLVKAYATLPLK